jgi:hypothetical protein
MNGEHEPAISMMDWDSWFISRKNNQIICNCDTIIFNWLNKDRMDGGAADETLAG